MYAGENCAGMSIPEASCLTAADPALDRVLPLYLGGRIRPGTDLLPAWIRLEGMLLAGCLEFPQGKSVIPSEYDPAAEAAGPRRTRRYLPQKVKRPVRPDGRGNKTQWN